MTAPVRTRNARTPLTGRTLSTASKLALAAVLATSATACRDPFEQGTKVAGWSVTSPSQRHPILVSQQPTTLTLKVPRGSYGLSPAQRADVIGFVAHFRSSDAGDSRLVIAAPGGSANEVAAMQAVNEVRQLVIEQGYDASSLHFEPYASSGGDAPVRLSYLRYVAEAPECGDWSTNLSSEPKNLAFPNFGCATQRNFAAMVTNPADLLGPRSSTPRPAERRDVTWDKFKKGESTVADKTDAEQVKMDGK